MYTQGDKLIIVSSDSHAGMPKELWPEYLPEKFHELLPGLRKDNEIYPAAIALLQAKFGLRGHPEHEDVHSTGWQTISASLRTGSCSLQPSGQ